MSSAGFVRVAAVLFVSLPFVALAQSPDAGIAAEDGAPTEVSPDVDEPAEPVAEETTEPEELPPPAETEPPVERPPARRVDRPAAPAAPPADTDEEDDEGLPINFIANLFTRYEIRTNYDEVGQSDNDAFRYRARFGLETDALEIGDDLTASVRVVPQASGTWNVGGDSLVDAGLGLHEGFLTLTTGPARVEVGRFEMAYGEHLVIGNVGWHPTGRSFDGSRLRLSTGPEKAWVDVFFTVLGEGSFGGGSDTDFAAGDRYFAGAYASFGPHLAEGLALDGYVLATISPETSTTDPMTMITTTTPTSHRWTIGARSKHRFGPIDYRVEAGLQLGRNAGDQSIVAGHADLEVGVNLLDGGLRLALEGLIASGDDPTSSQAEGYNHLFPTAHKWLGFSDIMGARTNVLSGVFHVKATVAEGFSLLLDAHLFARSQDVVIPGPIMPVTIDSGLAGFELDFGAKYVIAEGLSARGTYGLFLPNEDWYGSSEPAHFIELELAYVL